MSLSITPAEIVKKAEVSGRPGLLARAPGWDRIQLGDVARVVNGAAFPSAGFNSEGQGMPLIRIRDVTVGKTQTWFNGPWEQQHRVRHGDVLVGMDGDFRVERWRGGDAILNQRVCRIDVDESKYYARFLPLVLQGYLDAIWQETSSVTVKHLSSRSIAAIPLPCPSLDKQRRIVNLLDDHLSRLDAAVESLRASLRRADAMVVSSLAVQVTAGSEQWPASTVGQQAEVIQYGSGAKCGARDAEDDVPVLRMGDVKDGALVWGSLKYLPPNHEDFPKLLLKPGDLLFNRTNSAEHVGKSAVFDLDCPASFASYLIRVRLGPEVLPAWASMVINSPVGRGYIASVISQQVGQANVNGTKLKAFPLPLPSREEQDRRVGRHARMVESRERLRYAIDTATTRAAGLRRSLLAAAFSGRLTGSASDLSVAEEMIGA